MKLNGNESNILYIIDLHLRFNSFMIIEGKENTYTRSETKDASG